MDDDKKCSFCEIIDGIKKSATVYEDGDTIAFLDINPSNPGHVLVVSKKHFANIFDIETDILCKMASTAQKMALTMKKAVNADGVNLLMNNENAAGQLIFHAHMHVIPRFKDDGHKPWYGKPYKDGEMDEIAEKIKECVEK